MLALGVRQAGAGALERVPQRPVRDHRLVDREIAFEHAPRRAEGGDAFVDPRLPRRGQFDRARGVGALVPGRAAHDHPEPAQFGEHIVALRQLGDIGAPLREQFGAVVGVRPDPERAAEMVEHDAQLGECPGERGEFGDLPVIEHRVIAQPALRHPTQAVAVIGVGEQVRRRGPEHNPLGKGRIDRHAVPHPAQHRRCRGMRVELLVDFIAKRQVDKTDNSRGHRDCAHGGDLAQSLDAFGFADAAEVRRPVLAVAKARLDEHRCDNAMPAGKVVAKLVEQIGMSALDPQMMVRIDDRKLGFDDGLDPARQPPRVGRRVTIAAGHLKPQNPILF